MKKTISILLTIIMAFMLSLTAYADNESGSDNLDSVMEGINSQLEENIDENVREQLDEEEIKIKDPETVNNFSVNKLFSKIISEIAKLAGEPFKLIGKMIAITLVCVLAKSLAPDGSSVVKTFEIVSVISSVMVVIGYITQSINAVVGSLKAINTFMLSYIPVYASIIVTSGSPSAGTTYYVTLFALCEAITLIANKLFLPMMSIVMAISIVEAINPNLSFCNVADSLKKLVQWLLGAVMTIFVGILSVQSIIGVSADTVGVKAAKFAVSTFVPVVGGAVSDAFSTVRSSLGVIRSGIGGVGIIIIIFIVLQPIILTALLKLVTTICAIISEILDQKEIGKLMRNTSSIMSISLSVIICISLIFIVSTAVLMLAGLNLT